MSHSEEPSGKHSPRPDRVRQVINDCIARQAAGVEVTDESLMAAHPELMPELRVALKNLRLVQQAQQEAEQTASHQLHIRCPHCHNPIELVGESSLSDVVCPSCGSRFNPVDDASHTFHAAPHDMVNHFQLLDKLGVGAFGTVWSARDTQLDRVVALKIPRKGQFSSEDAENFIREARAAAQLHHPNIVSVFEVGRHEDRVYIACDFVQGLDLADWLTDGHPTFREAAEVCATLADALQHAHDHGVIHRDLKPSNIMLDTNGQPYLMDFGLAKREAAEMTVTVDGKLLGTPAYMSPEQARGAAHDADARSDLYSLGVILFELLTGHRPFRGSTRMLLHQVLTEDAPSPRKLNAGVPRDLETICLKCLEKAPDRRYQTAGALRDELLRFLRGEPVLARPISRFSRVWRLAKRHPAAAGVVLLVSVLAILGPLVAIRMWSLASSESAARKDANRLLYTSDMAIAQQSVKDARLAHAIELLERHQPQPSDEYLTRFEWYHLWGACRRSIMSPSFRQFSVAGLRFMPDGETLISADAQGNIVHRNVNTLEVTAKYEFSIKGFAYQRGEQFSSDGRIFAIGQTDGTVKLREYRTRQEYILGTPQSTIFLTSTAFSPKEPWFASAASDGSVTLWNLETRHAVWHVQAHNDRVYGLAFSPDGDILATGGLDGKAKLWSVSTGGRVADFDVGELCGSLSSVWSVAFSHDGRKLATGTSGDNAVMLWDVLKKRFIRRLGTNPAFITILQFSPDDAILASAGGTIKLWDVQQGYLLDSLCCEVRGSTAAIDFSPDGGTLASAYMGATSGVKLWRLEAPANPRVLHHRDPVSAGAISDDARTLVTACESKGITVWDTQSGTKLCEISTQNKPTWKVAVTHDGRYIATAGIDNVVNVWDATTGDLVHTLRHAAKAYLAAFSPHDDLLATGTEDGAVYLWHVDRWTLKKRLDSLNGCLPVHTLTFSPNGRLLLHSGWQDLPGGPDYGVTLWDLATFRPQRPIHGAGVFSAAFSSQSTQLACGLYSGDVLLWDVVNQRELHRLQGHAASVSALTFSPDDRTLMTSSGRNVRFWNTRTGKFRFELDAHRDSISFLAMASDGLLFTGSADGTAKIWSAATPADVDRIRRRWATAMAESE